MHTSAPLFATNLRHCRDKRTVRLPAITRSENMIYCRVSGGFRGIPHSVYLTAPNTRVLRSVLYGLLSSGFIPSHIPAGGKESYLDDRLNEPLASLSAQEEISSIDLGGATRFPIKLGNDLTLRFVTNPGSMPPGLDLIARVWVVFEVDVDSKSFRAEVPQDRSLPIDRLMYRLDKMGSDVQAG